MTLVQQWEGEELDANLKEHLKAVRYFHPTRSAMLFADRVILVEGATEQMMIPLLAEEMGLKTGDVEVVDCNGAGGL